MSDDRLRFAERRNMASDAQPYHGDATTQALPRPTGLTAAFTLKGVRQVKAITTALVTLWYRRTFFPPALQLKLQTRAAV